MIFTYNVIDASQVGCTTSYGARLHAATCRARANSDALGYTSGADPGREGGWDG